MLIEIPDAAGGASGDRRWFRGDALELVVWADDEGVRRYQLRYRRPGRDGVFEWRRPGEFAHYRLDDGEGRAARVDAAPLLHPDAPGTTPDPDTLAWVRDRFRTESEGMEDGLRTWIERTLTRPW